MIISFINIDIPMPFHYIRFTGIFLGYFFHVVWGTVEETTLPLKAVPQ